MNNQTESEYYLPRNTFTDLYFSIHKPDLEIQIKDEIVKVQKTLLVMYSSVFKTMLLECRQD